MSRLKTIAMFLTFSLAASAAMTLAIHHFGPANAQGSEGNGGFVGPQLVRWDANDIRGRITELEALLNDDESPDQAAYRRELEDLRALLKRDGDAAVVHKVVGGAVGSLRPARLSDYQLWQRNNVSAGLPESWTIISAGGKTFLLDSTSGDVWDLAGNGSHWSPVPRLAERVTLLPKEEVLETGPERKYRREQLMRMLNDITRELAVLDTDLK